MKNQKGFTLIELLLVLAIIGIISAIAIPALLSQRARARDKASISNLNGRIGDLVGQWDRLKEGGTPNSQTTAALNSYLTNTAKSDRSPWVASQLAFATIVSAQATSTTAISAVVSDIKGIAATMPKGQVAFKVWFPQAGGGTAVVSNVTVVQKPGSGFIAGGVMIDGLVNGTNVVTKVSALE
ncbi:prepilin-type N-terminal cleavage/methylation domain-containing protein [Geothrix fuzhouensis]|uniref:prepilin-type N-terminal cleavage/methylation domain-containing protein n=1 Tax=Geothrix fuzhouensis TaxID=2966451 RepID=UPI0027D2D084|nr:prepilin-type N-terminal cleavage/methylation domain-containing protein [Geothrix fuzhouensis]